MGGVPPTSKTLPFDPAGLADEGQQTKKRQEPIATPCRAADPPKADPPKDDPSKVHSAKHDTVSSESDQEVPFVDSNAEKPVVGVLRISQAAIDQRMRRVMTPNRRTGEFKVSKQIVDMYKSKQGKSKLEKMFQSVGYDPESFITEVEMYREDLLSDELIIEGEYASEDTMRDQWNWSESFGNI